MNKKVLFLIHTLGVGGAEKVLVDTVNQLSKTMDVTVMTVIDTGAFKEKLSSNVRYRTIFSLPKKYKNDSSGSLLSNKSSLMKKFFVFFYQIIWRFMPTKLIYNKFIKDNYDVEVAFLEGITAKCLRHSKNKKVVWIHVDLLNENKSDKVFHSIKDQKKCYASFDKVICVSEVVKKQFVSKYGDLNNSVSVLYNPINKKDIVEKSLEKVEDLIIDNSICNIATIGRLSPQKGYDRLIEVVKRLVDLNYKFKLYIIGVGPLYDEFIEKVNTLSLNNYIEFLGFKKNPYKYITKCDFFVCSSYAEGFSTVVSEASILEIPTVTTDCSGMKELFLNNEYGYIVENNTDDLFEGVKYFLDNKKVIKNYKNKLVELGSRFDIEKSVKEIEDMLHEIIL